MFKNKWAVLIGLLLITGIIAFVMNARGKKKKENMENIENIEKVHNSEMEQHIKSMKESEIELEKLELAKKQINDTVKGINIHDSDELSQLEGPAQYLLDDGMNGEVKTFGNLCSLDCCSPDWRKQKVNDGVEDPAKFIKTNIYCRNSTQSSGCMCVTPQQKKHIESRGGNAI